MLWRRLAGGGVLTVLLTLSPCGHARPPAAVDALYARTCSLCHDGGAGQAPRLADTLEWQRRARQGRDSLYRVAIAGKAGSAMGPRGGFAQLSDAELGALVDYMLDRAGVTASGLPALATADRAETQQPLAASPASGTAPFSDDTLSQHLAAALRTQLGQPGNAIEYYDHVFTVRGLGIKVRSDQGVITLSGTVEKTEQIEQAQAIASAMPGVRRVVNRMLSAALMEWD